MGGLSPFIHLIHPTCLISIFFADKVFFVKVTSLSKFNLHSLLYDHQNFPSVKQVVQLYGVSS